MWSMTPIDGVVDHVVYPQKIIKPKAYLHFNE